MTRTTDRRSRRRSPGWATLAATLTIGLGVVLTGCSEVADPAGKPTSEPTTAPSSEPASSEPTTEPPTESAAEGQIVDITISGDTVDPSGERVDATVGEEIILRVTADAPGEIHVHSTPEQELSYDAGTTELPLTIDQPGLVDVESHDLGLVIVQLEVR